MVTAEAALPADQRIDFVSIVTRNNTHAPIATAFLQAGFHIVCDKPLCFDLKEALKLREVVRKSGKVFALTHNYTGYPMVKEARDWVRSGKLGKLLKVVVEYPQGYAITALEAATISKIANWRMDPSVSGSSNCMGDIGTHAHNLARYITGLEAEEICAELSTFIPGRLLDDDGNCLVRFSDGVKGILYASRDLERRGEQPQHPRLRHQGFAAVVSGEPERAHLQEGGCTAAGVPTRQRLRRRGRPRRNTHALRAPRRFHRGLCQHLPRRGHGHR
jgi:predicted dehydrogenase